MMTVTAPTPTIAIILVSNGKKTKMEPSLMTDAISVGQNKNQKEKTVQHI